ncbi:ATP-binding SpoIIE family protein phosphatase [Microbispora sp. ATCC PTA-5024]|uniref:ATP-binding SpoIIE family protein phosphatase n=1 Tax=Microbispora sp. ATCC PTA-5024 TaxID=316330 RepID=UPI0003DC88EC|nr:ATP-binding SpoIIE family protein phosphatase [Microbispora sp. ATCC PTA-5024]ETK32093.1 magnesium or manganese-dependent protein phosphatase [Microbispora sp. ATCC PTA-5024]
MSWDGETLDLLGYLSEAAQAIGDSPSPEEAARVLCEAAVPRLADAAAVYVDGGVRHRVDRAGRLPPRWHDDRRRGPARLDDHLIAVPLRAYGKPVGCVVLARDRQRPSFADADLLAAAQLGVPAALTIFHGHRHRQQVEAVEILQRGIRPGAPPVLPGLEISFRYEPAAERVGGDWFDVIPLPGSRVALVVGDVMGHGLPAAAVMGQLRTAVQTLASLDLPAEQVLHSLDEMAQRLAAQTLTTCVYCVYDPVLRRCTIASAGHLPPVLVRPDGGADLLSPPRCPPIGLGRTPFETMEIAAEDGSMLVLYTDGLVEQRGQDIGQSVETLRRRVAGGAHVEDLCDDALSSGRSDDVTLLAIRFRGIPSGHVAQWMMEPQPATPGRVRGLVRRTLTSWGLEPMIPVAQLLASELVTNAVRQTSRPITIRLLRTDALLCEVSDDDHRLPILREPGVLDEDGRGMYLVSQLAERWGASRVAGGKTVWFSMPIPAGLAAARS